MKFVTRTSSVGIGTTGTGIRANAKALMLKGAQRGLRFVQDHPRLIEKAQSIIDTISSLPTLGPDLVPVTGGKIGHDLGASINRLSDKLSLMMMGLGDNVGFSPKEEWGLTEQHRMVRESVAEFAENIMKGELPKNIREGIFPKEVFRKMGELGFLGSIISEEYGGSNMDVRTLAIIMEEVAYRSPSIALSLDITGGLIPHIISVYGTKAQKNKYLPQIVSGESIAAFALTEPDVGTDVSSMHANARLDGDKFIINGNKRFITNGTVADVIVLFARVMGKKEKSDRDFSAFLIDAKALKEKGQLKISEMEDKMGCHGTGTAELVFENAEIPKDAILGEISSGKKIALGALNIARIEIAAFALGAARRAFDISANYQKERTSFGEVLAQKQLTQSIFGGMMLRLEPARQLIYRAAFLADIGETGLTAAAVAKVVATKMAVEVINRAQTKMGGDGYMMEYGVAGLFQDIMVGYPGEGDNDVLQMLIGALSLGQGRASL